MSSEKPLNADEAHRQELIAIHIQNLLRYAKQRDELLKTNQRIPLFLANSIWDEEDALRGLTKRIGSNEEIARHDISAYGVSNLTAYDRELLTVHHGNILHLQSEEKRLGISVRSEIEYEQNKISSILAGYNH